MRKSRNINPSTIFTVSKCTAHTKKRERFLYERKKQQNNCKIKTEKNNVWMREIFLEGKKKNSGKVIFTYVRNKILSRLV